MRRNSGFTLIELLVVIAIIAILAAILFPVFARAREKARQTSCLSNVKQIMLGAKMYVQDYDETWPIARLYTVSGTSTYGSNPGFWPNLLMPYVKNEQVFVCPSYGPGSKHGSSSWCSYGWNLGLAPTWATIGHGMGYYEACIMTPTGTPLNEASIPYPAETVVIGDCGSNSYSGNGIYVIPYSMGYLAVVHNDGGNFGYADGHAKWMKNTEACNNPVFRVDK